MNGREYHGLVYFATDENGTTIATPFKSSRLGKFAGREAIEQRFVRAKDKVEPQKTKAIVAPILAASNDKDDFIARLKEAKVDVLFRYTDEGRIYGVTFIDHNNLAVLNGSRLGKEFSANALESRFNNPENCQKPSMPDIQSIQTDIHNDGDTRQSQSDDSQQRQESATPPPNPSSTQSQSSHHHGNSSDYDNSPMLPGLDLFQVGPGFNAEEEAFYREMQRRKKKKRRGPKL